MKRRKLLTKTRVKVLNYFLIFTLVFGIVSNACITSVKADSTSKIQTFLSMAAGKNETDLNLEDLQLTSKDLQFLGVYISNFFVPFGTELGSGAEDVDTMNKEDIKKALQTNLAFSDVLADSMTETLLGLSRSSVSNQTLSFYVSKEYQDGNLEQVENIPLNYTNALTSMLGGFKHLAAKNSNESLSQGISNGTYKYGYFAYLKGGKVTPVFDFSIDGSVLTPSMTAFIKCLESVDTEKGYGFNFFDFTLNESGDEDTRSQLAESSTNSDVYRMSHYGSSMAIDSFGNIIIMGGNHQFIAVPGAMNPYTWKLVDENGRATENSIGGSAYNIMNIPSMALLINEKNKLFTKRDSAKTSDILTSADKVSADGNITVELKGLMGNSAEWQYELGNKDIKGSKLEEYLIKVIKNSTNGSTVNPIITVQNGSIAVSGKASELSNLSQSSLEGAISSGDKDLSKAISELEKKYKIFVYTDAGTAYGLIDNITLISKQANEKLVTNSKDVNVSKESLKISIAEIDTSVLASRLSKINEESVFKGGDDSQNTYALRRIRGDVTTNMSTGFLWNNDSFKRLAEKAEAGFYETYQNSKLYNDISTWAVNEVYIPGAEIINGQVSPKRNISVLDSFVFIDDLGAFHGNKGDEVPDYKTFNVIPYLKEDEAQPVRESMKNYAKSSNSFSSTYNNIKDGKMEIPTNVSKEAMIGLYVTYAFASLYDENNTESMKSTIGQLGYKLNVDSLPEVPNEALAISTESQSDVMLTSIRDWVYYLLHPTEGLEYFSTWIKTKIGSFLVSWHNDMVGTNGTGSINGTTKYRGTSGYVTTPELSDMPWSSSLMNIYQNAIPFIIVAFLIFMTGAYIVGVFSFQKAIIGFLVFSLTAQLPSIIINGVVGTSNRFSSNLYGEKFTYWALVQHESYADEIDRAASQESYDNYLRTLYDTNAQKTGNQGGESVMLKWQAPKKMASLMMTNADETALQGFRASKLISGLVNSTYSGESYLDNDSVYLYRSYIDIANFSRYIHRGLSGNQPIKSTNRNITNDLMSSWNPSLKEAMLNYSATYEADRNMGYANKNGDGSVSGTGNNILRVKVPLSSYIVSDAYAKLGTVKNMTINDYVGINQDAFNFSIPMFNVKDLDFKSELKTENFDADKYSEEDYSGLASYGLMSENPFYYFSWYLYESGLSETTTTKTGYKNLLLGDDKLGFFYNSKGNGELKDIVDMRSLFTYIIPYLKQGNDLVDEWDKTYGIFTYEGVPTEEGHQNDADIVNNPELKQKYWHNLNVARLYNVYTPWVDIMYDTSYADEEKISYLGETYVVQDPINPSSYPEERPMIFSRSEMVDYGLKESQLTEVERKILEVQEGIQKRMVNLLNYYSFSDTVLNTAAAMNCAFEFNTVFSENSMFGSNKNIYSQSFELNDFSYDAFLRFILSNSTGDSMIVNKGDDFYLNIVENSSITTILVMLVLDIIAVYILPALKMFFVIGMFIMALLTILVSVFRIDPRFNFIKTLIKSVISPMFKFLLTSCGMALVVSWFMGDGNTAVAGASSTSISLGDPVMVMVAMIVVNGIVLFIYAKLLLKVLQDIKTSSKLVFNFSAGVIGEVGGLVAGSAAGRVMGLASGVSNGMKRGGRSSEGVGSPSSSASKRGNFSINDKEVKKDTTYENTKSRGKGLFKKAKPMNTFDSKVKNKGIDSKISKGLNKMKKK